MPSKLPKGGLWCPAAPGTVSTLNGPHNCLVTYLNPAFLYIGLRISLATFAARARCPILQSCFPADQPPACTGAWGCGSPGAGHVYPQVPRVVSKQIVSYDGRDFVPQVPALRFSVSRGLVTVPVKTEENDSPSTTAFSMLLATRPPGLFFSKGGERLHIT